MSILDENYEDKLQDEVKWGLDRMSRTNVKVFHCTDILTLTKHIYYIQQWIYEHWITNNLFELRTINELIGQHPLFPDCWGSGSYSHAKMFINDPPVVGMDYSKYLIPIPQRIHNILLFMRELNDVEMKDHPKNFIARLQNMTIITPTPVINTRLGSSADYIDDIDDIVTYSVTYSPCTLMLRDVVDIPSYIGKFIDDDVFLWSIPVDKIYLYKCPQIDPRFLKLPYVETFEEKGWFI